VIYNADGLSALGSLTAAGRPGGELLLSFLYQANHPVNKDARIASVIRSHPQMQIWEEQNNVYTAVRAVTTPIFLSKGQSVLIRLKVHMPLDRGSFGVHIGSLAYVLESSGMRVHTQLTSSYQIYKNDGTTVYSGPQNSSSSAHAQTPAPSAAHGQDPHMIRIRLHDSADTQPATVTLSTSAPPTVSGQSFVGKSIVLSQNGNGCVAAEDGRQVASAVVRIDPGDGIATLASWQKTRNRFRGIMECRVIDGQLALINELPLEDYMAGLAEEPDTQAYEKQRAFAIAARTYAAYYLDPSHRKFPGQPYDGSDSPAEFQVYGGAVFESANPQWVRAVQTTMGNVLTVNGDGIKPPYFTSDDGRTRSPVEAGWGNAYPHAAVFASKPDPWCQGMRLSGHGVGMSGCGATGQAKADKTAEQILQYYYPGAVIARQ
jgi:peptidoglycan hydrolase-like amidase